MYEEGLLLGLLLIAGAVQVHLLLDYAMAELLLFEAFVLVTVLVIVRLHQHELARGRLRLNLSQRVPAEDYHERARVQTEQALSLLKRDPRYHAWIKGEYAAREGRRLVLQENSSSESDYDECTLHEVATRKKLF